MTKLEEVRALIAELERVETQYQDTAEQGWSGWALLKREIAALRDYEKALEAIGQAEKALEQRCALCFSRVPWAVAVTDAVTKWHEVDGDNVACSLGVFERQALVALRQVRGGHE